MIGCFQTKAALAFFVFLLLGCCSIVRCALPPSAYKEWKMNAEEYVSVKVVAVAIPDPVDRKPREPCTRVDYMARVEIQKVIREPSDLAVGDVVTLNTWFTTDGDCPPGPSSPPTIGIGCCGNVYMNSVPGGDNFEVAAGGESFVEGACGLRPCLNQVVKKRCSCKAGVGRKKRVATARRCARRKARNLCSLKGRDYRRVQSRLANFCA